LRFPKLRLAKLGDVQYEDVEEIDLSNDPPPATPTSFSSEVPHAFRKFYDLHKKVGMGGSFRLSRQPLTPFKQIERSQILCPSMDREEEA
jgi:hypothetical protein